jgi:hypothetical protein
MISWYHFLLTITCYTFNITKEDIMTKAQKAFRKKAKRNGIILALVLLSALLVAKLAPAAEIKGCKPVVHRGTLYTDSGFVVPACGVVIDMSDAGDYR